MKTNTTKRPLSANIGETHEAYPFVVKRWNFTGGKATRIVECKAGIQWIIQYFSGGRWRNAKFCRTRGNLLAHLPGYADDIRYKFPEVFPEAEAAAKRKAA